MTTEAVPAGFGGGRLPLESKARGTGSPQRSPADLDFGRGSLFPRPGHKPMLLSTARLVLLGFSSRRELPGGSTGWTVQLGGCRTSGPSCGVWTCLPAPEEPRRQVFPVTETRSEVGALMGRGPTVVSPGPAPSSVRLHLLGTPFPSWPLPQDPAQRSHRRGFGSRKRPREEVSARPSHGNTADRQLTLLSAGITQCLSLLARDQGGNLSLRHRLPERGGATRALGCVGRTSGQERPEARDQGRGTTMPAISDGATRQSLGA